ncbi:MAG: hypothetical protein WC773_02125 [Patescibacteria group bacterium]|jgi:hypothetical protein
MRCTKIDRRSLHGWKTLNPPGSISCPNRPDEVLERLGSQFWRCLNFVRSAVPDALGINGLDAFAQAENGCLNVVAEFEIPGSVMMPVVEVIRKDGLTLVMKPGDQWIISVDSPSEVSADFMGLLDPSLHPTPDDIPAEFIFDQYAIGARRFTAVIRGDPVEHKVFAFLWLLGHYQPSR